MEFCRIAKMLVMCCFAQKCFAILALAGIWLDARS